jgi:proprotein convertase subtilisin/kexin type 5
MGRIKFNTAYALDGTTLTNRLFADTTASALSEMIHIIGFDSALYTSYLDSTINNTYVSQIMQTATGLAAGRSVTQMITTPNVVTWARSWFNCPTINGMLLENEASDGNSYWDRTLMYDEIMTRTALSAQRGISGLTFALLKDMGWYTVDDTFNDTSPYGYKKGCEFFFNGCNSTTTFT